MNGLLQRVHQWMAKAGKHIAGQMSNKFVEVCAGTGRLHNVADRTPFAKLCQAKQGLALKPCHMIGKLAAEKCQHLPHL